MDSWKTLIIATLVMLSPQALADENKGSYDRSMLLVLLSPTFLVSGTTGLSELAVHNFKPAKADALAFIGSSGEIRGAQFEQATRYYHAAYAPPHMNDEQLALAIATTF
ncbi:DUF2388 domain-containing protein [Pseudomonas sp. Irchel 3E13]|jgi:uncharacterized protein (TIGR02448 family)|uniref:DUF2388 domain-containing protein n=1 Tax=Pseudomonas sp. Irchel 3E13 TaxID=2008975 RepID=UPI000BA4D51A|nr:DUF2388 domain-containing protein [Pseudomonas sp. Irchel 3E13]